MLTRFFTVLLFLACVSFTTNVDDRPTAEILAEVLEERDACDVRTLFRELGKRGDEEALTAIVRGRAVLAEDRNSASAVRPLAQFVDAPVQLQEKVVEYLDECLRDPKDKHKYTLANALVAFGPVAEKELLQNLDRGHTSLVRGLLLRGVLDTIVDEGGARNLERVLLHFHEGTSGEEADLIRALTALFGPAQVHSTVKILGRANPLPYNVKQIVAAFSTIPGRAVDKLFGELANASNPKLRELAVEALLFREGKAATKLLKDRFKKEKSAGAQGKALTGLLARPDTASKAEKSLARAAKSKSDSDREMVAVALGVPGIGDIQLLLPLIADEVKSVRQAALASAVARRNKVVIAALIERLDVEVDTKLVDVHGALRKLTGQDFGERPHRWRSWWGKEGKTFELPSTLDARRQTSSRDLERMRRDRGSQYGLNPKGSGIYFLLDVSDSMNRVYDYSSKKGARGEWLKDIDILGEEMVGVVERMRDDQMFNVLRFGSSVEKLAPALIPLTAESRLSATEFVQRKKTLGATALYDALEVAFEDRGMDTVYIITDGEPEGGKVDDPAKVLAQVRKWNRKGKVKIHCIDLHRIASDFLKNLSERNGGQFHHVPPPS